MIWGQPNSRFQECFQGFFSQSQVLGTFFPALLLTVQDFWKHSTYIITVYICMTYKLYILCTCSEGKNTTIFAAWWCWWETKVCNKGILNQQYKRNSKQKLFSRKVCQKSVRSFCNFHSVQFLGTFFYFQTLYKYFCKVKLSYLFFQS